MEKMHAPIQSKACVICDYKDLQAEIRLGMFNIWVPHWLLWIFLMLSLMDSPPTHAFWDNGEYTPCFGDRCKWESAFLFCVQWKKISYDLCWKLLGQIITNLLGFGVCAASIVSNILGNRDNVDFLYQVDPLTTENAMCWLRFIPFNLMVLAGWREHGWQSPEITQLI